MIHLSLSNSVSSSRGILRHTELLAIIKASSNQPRQAMPGNLQESPLKKKKSWVHCFHVITVLIWSSSLFSCYLKVRYPHSCVSAFRYPFTFYLHTCNLNYFSYHCQTNGKELLENMLSVTHTMNFKWDLMNRVAFHQHMAICGLHAEWWRYTWSILKKGRKKKKSLENEISSKVVWLVVHFKINTCAFTNRQHLISVLQSNTINTNCTKQNLQTFIGRSKG